VREVHISLAIPSLEFDIKKNMGLGIATPAKRAATTRYTSGKTAKQNKLIRTGQAKLV
jgi:hypothetical protein